MGAGRRCETPGSEMKGSLLLVSTAVVRVSALLLQVFQAPVLMGPRREAQMETEHAGGFITGQEL